MALTGLFGRGNLGRLQIEIELPEEIFAGRPTLAHLRIENRRRRLPGFLLQVECAGERLLFPLVPAGAFARRPLPLRFPRRGTVALPEITLQSSFPVNFFTRRFRFQPDGSALVFPAPLTAHPPDSDREPPKGDDITATRSGQDGDLRAITDYQGGEPLKAIHWKLSARQDELKVKRHAGLASPPLTIDLAQLPGPLEERLSRACGLVLGASRAGRPVGLRLPTTEFAPGSDSHHRRRLLRELALHAEG